MRSECGLCRTAARPSLQALNLVHCSQRLCACQDCRRSFALLYAAPYAALYAALYAARGNRVAGRGRGAETGPQRAANSPAHSPATAHRYDGTGNGRAALAAALIVSIVVRPLPLHAVAGAKSAAGSTIRAISENTGRPQ